MTGISAVIITFNEETTLARCLRALDWVDEILVVDSESTDLTREIAERHGATVVTNKWPGYAAQRNFGTSLVHHEWVLTVDADEIVSSALRAEILNLEVSPLVDSYRIPRKEMVAGKWVKHGGFWPQYHVRLYRRHLKWQGIIHERIESRNCGKLRGPLVHFSHLSIDVTLDKIVRYSVYESRQYSGYSKWTLWLLMASIPPRFFKRLVLNGVLLDGWRGVLMIFAMYSSYFLGLLRALETMEKSPS